MCSITYVKMNLCIDEVQLQDELQEIASFDVPLVLFVFAHWSELTQGPK